MIIEPRMNLGQLLYLMPDDATYHEAYKLRATLLRDHNGESTKGIPAAVWRDLVADAMRDAEPVNGRATRRA